MYMYMCIWHRDIKNPRFVEVEDKIRNATTYAMIGHRFGHQSGQHESYGHNSAARLRSFSLCVSLVVASKLQI